MNPQLARAPLDHPDAIAGSRRASNAIIVARSRNSRLYVLGAATTPILLAVRVSTEPGAIHASADYDKRFGLLSVTHSVGAVGTTTDSVSAESFDASLAGRRRQGRHRHDLRDEIPTVDATIWSQHERHPAARHRQLPCRASVLAMPNAPTSVELGSSGPTTTPGALQRERWQWRRNRPAERGAAGR